MSLLFRVPRSRFNFQSSPPKMSSPTASLSRSSALVSRAAEKNPAQFYPTLIQPREGTSPNQKQIYGYSPNTLNTPTSRSPRLLARAPQSVGLERELERLKINSDPGINTDQG